LFRALCKFRYVAESRGSGDDVAPDKRRVLRIFAEIVSFPVEPLNAVVATLASGERSVKARASVEGGELAEQGVHQNGTVGACFGTDCRQGVHVSRKGQREKLVTVLAEKRPGFSREMVNRVSEGGAQADPKNPTSAVLRRHQGVGRVLQLASRNRVVTSVHAPAGKAPAEVGAVLIPKETETGAGFSGKRNQRHRVAGSVHTVGTLSLLNLAVELGAFVDVLEPGGDLDVGVVVEDVGDATVGPRGRLQSAEANVSTHAGRTHAEVGTEVLEHGSGQGVQTVSSVHLEIAVQSRTLTPILYLVIIDSDGSTQSNQFLHHQVTTHVGESVTIEVHHVTLPDLKGDTGRWIPS